MKYEFNIKAYYFPDTYAAIPSSIVGSIEGEGRDYADAEAHALELFLNDYRHYSENFIDIELTPYNA